MTLTMQLFQGFYQRKFLDLIENHPFPNCKPHGGLWTSTYDRKIGSDWLAWQKGEQWYKSSCKVGYLLKPKKETRVYHIDHYADLILLISMYPFKKKGHTHIDFKMMCRDYDAIHLTQHGQWKTRLTDPNLYGWDCENTLWLNPTFTVKKEIPLKKNWF